MLASRSCARWYLPTHLAFLPSFTLRTDLPCPHWYNPACYWWVPCVPYPKYPCRPAPHAFSHDPATKMLSSSCLVGAPEFSPDTRVRSLPVSRDTCHTVKETSCVLHKLAWCPEFQEESRALVQRSFPRCSPANLACPLSGWHHHLTGAWKSFLYSLIQLIFAIFSLVAKKSYTHMMCIQCDISVHV